MYQSETVKTVPVDILEYSNIPHRNEHVTSPYAKLGFNGENFERKIII